MYTGSIFGKGMEDATNTKEINKSGVLADHPAEKDTIAVMLTPAELQSLENALGRKGTPHPVTGVLSFFDVGDVGEPDSDIGMDAGNNAPDGTGNVGGFGGGTTSTNANRTFTPQQTISRTAPFSPFNVDLDVNSYQQQLEAMTTPQPTPSQVAMNQLNAALGMVNSNNAGVAFGRGALGLGMMGIPGGTGLGVFGGMMNGMGGMSGSPGISGSIGESIGGMFGGLGGGTSEGGTSTAAEGDGGNIGQSVVSQTQMPTEAPTETPNDPTYANLTPWDYQLQQWLGNDFTPAPLRRN
jgi:hypothetical protein